MYVISVYDINTEEKPGQRRLQKTFKIFKKYLSHIQKSVFEGEITPANLEKLKTEVRKTINHKTDSVIFFQSRNPKWVRKDMIGLQIDKTDNFI